MNEVLRYEEAIQSQLSQLPLPDENFAWQEMKKLLEEDDDDAVIVPPPVRKGCAGLAALLLAGLVAGWFILKPLRWFRSSSTVPASVETKTKTVPPGESAQQPSSGFQTNKTEQALPETSDTAAKNKNTKGLKGSEQNDNSLSGSQAVVRETTLPENSTGTVKPPRQLTRTSGRITNTNPSAASPGKMPANKSGAQQKAQQKVKTYKPDISQKPVKETRKGYDPSADLPQKKTTETRETTKTTVSGNEQPSVAVLPPAEKQTAITPPPANNNSGAEKKDSVPRNKPPTPAPVSPAAETKKEKTPKKFWFATGIALTQQVPLSGQQSTPYNYYGRRSSLADYIPSVYVRLHREKKWFVQGEFRYGAPQYTKDFVYSNTTVTDSFSQSRITTSYRVKKTFYHQLPVSFHYTIRPGWSIGTGMVVNRFFGAVSEEDIRRRIPGTTIDSLISQKLVYSNARTDSSFEKTNLQWLFETQYKWKRFTLGARYSVGLQPYIRFTDAATGQPREEKNHNLNIFLRFELWNSGKKK